MAFTITGRLQNVRTFATGSKIRELRRVVRTHGFGQWHKRKGTAMVQLDDGSLVLAELHWYEAKGVGKRELKIKRILSDYD